MSSRAERRRQRPVTPGASDRPAAPGWLEKAGALPWLWPVLGGLTLVVLIWAMRGFPPGVPVADDYYFLNRITFHQPLDPFDSMGATYYWRPLSRQVYFSLVGGHLIRTPWVAGALHLAILLLTYVLIYRIARRGFAPPVAAAIAVFPLVSEPVRALVAWPSGAQHLLAGLFAALTVHEAVAGRWLTAAPAGLAGVLSHESAALAVLAMPVIAWLRRRAAAASGNVRPSLLPPLLAVAFVWAAWGVGYAIASGHGVLLPPRQPGLFPLLKLPDVFQRAVRAALNFEDLSPSARGGLLTLDALLAGWAAFVLTRRDALARVRSIAPALILCGSVFLIGVLPLTWLLPDWNAWRAWVPTLALGTGLTALLGAASPAVALAFAGLRMGVLFVAMPGTELVRSDPPATHSHMSYPRIVRLQRIVESTRRELTGTYPHLEHGSFVRFWQLVHLAEVGFGDTLAIPIWYRDTTVHWSRFGGSKGVYNRTDALVEYVHDVPMPAVLAEPNIVRLYLLGTRAHSAGRFAEAESLYTYALKVATTRTPIYGIIGTNLSRVHLARGDIEGARAIADTAAKYHVDSADFWETRAMIAFTARDFVEAERAARLSIASNADSPGAAQVLSALKAMKVIK